MRVCCLYCYFIRVNSFGEALRRFHYAMSLYVQLWDLSDSWGQQRGLQQILGHGGTEQILLGPGEGAAASSWPARRCTKKYSWDGMSSCLGSRAASLCHVHSGFYDCMLYLWSIFTSGVKNVFVFSFLNFYCHFVYEGEVCICRSGDTSYISSRALTRIYQA